MIKNLLSLVTCCLLGMSATFGQNSDLRITYDANQGVSGLAGASKVYMYSGAVTSGPSGQWEWITGSPNLDDGIGQMTSLGNNLWTICIDPMSYYSSGVAGPIPNGSTIYAIDLFFRNENGTLFGYDFNNSYMIIDMTTNPPSSNFSGLAMSGCTVGLGEVPLQQFVMNNFPNPLKTNTQINYNLTQPATRVEIKVYDMLGQKVKSFSANNQKTGLYKIQWNGDNDKGNLLRNGIYFYTLEVDGVKIRSNRMIISR